MLGARIAALRRANGMSQAELARHLQISPSAVGMYEQGRREPAVELLVQLARLFEVSVDYLLTGQAISGQEKNNVDQLLKVALQKAEDQLRGRKHRPFSRQELAVLFAALLMDVPEKTDEFDP